MPFSAARLAADTLRILPRKRLSRLLGSLADVDGPQVLVDRAVDAFVRAYDVNLDEAVVPEGGSPSFNAFFTRRLKPGVRPIDPDSAVVVSPADGLLEDQGRIDLASTLTVKGKLYDVGELLGDDALASRYEGGTYFIIYLSPRDYHRVHAPVSGRVDRIRYVPGTLYPVNRIGTEHVPRLFARNERVTIVQQSPMHGEVASVLVGAIGVGRVGLAFHDLKTNFGFRPGERVLGEGGPTIDRGEELGVFHLGSTVVCFFPPERPVELLVASGTKVNMGRAVARVEGGSLQ